MERASKTKGVQGVVLPGKEGGVRERVGEGLPRADMSEPSEFIQTEKGSVLAKIPRPKDLKFDPNTGERLKDRFYYKILGIGAALGLGGAIMPDEANAFPIGKIGKIVKDMTKIALKEPSSAASNLIGKVMQGKVIKAVQKGKGDWRYLLFEDGSGLPVTKDFLESVSRAQGTKDYMAKFRAAEDAEKLEMAKKSLNRHLAKTTGLSTKRLTETYSTKHMERLDRLGLEGLEKPNLVGVWSSGRYVKMPKEYAELLEANGLVKIDRSRK